MAPGGNMKNRKAVALLLALFSLVIVSLLLFAFFEATTTDLQIANNHLSRSQAYYIAEAGIEYGVSVLRNSKANFSQVLEFPPGSGNTYSVTYSSVSGKITSIGSLASGGQVTLETKVAVLGASSPYQVKIISSQEL